MKKTATDRRKFEDRRQNNNKSKNNRKQLRRIEDKENLRTYYIMLVILGTILLTMSALSFIWG